MLYDTRGHMEDKTIRDVCPKCDQITLLVSGSEKFIFCSDIECLWHIDTEIWIDLWGSQSYV